MRAVGRDLIRGGHYGQRSCEPHQKAEHMAAPTNAAKREESSCQPGAVHTWHKTDMRRRPDDVRSWGQNGPRGYDLRARPFSNCRDLLGLNLKIQKFSAGLLPRVWLPRSGGWA